MKQILELLKDPKVFVMVLGMSGTVSTGLWGLIKAQAELTVKKEYDKVLTDYAIQLASCK